MVPGDERRKCVLTELDIERIADTIESHRHQCRYEIDPAEFRDLIAFVKSFKASMDDSKAIVRRFVIGALLAALSGLIGFKTWQGMK